MSHVKARRTYVSPRRAATAAATRAAILDAAGTRFRDVGYASTTIDDIARDATVSPKTIYAVFGTKRGILHAVLDRAIAGDDLPVPILERAWVQAMRDEPEPRGRLRILAREGARILADRAAIDALIDRAADSEPDIAVLAAEARAQRRAGQAALLRIALGPGPVSETAVDTLFAIGSPEVYRLLIDQGWSDARFARWYADTLTRCFLPLGQPARVSAGSRPSTATR